MKATIIGIVFLLIVGIVGFLGYQYLQKSQSQQAAPAPSATVTASGTVQAAVPPGDDYTHLLMGEKTVKLNSYSVQLQNYVGKKVEATGEYSGNTLFVDSVVEIQ